MVSIKGAEPAEAHGDAIEDTPPPERGIPRVDADTDLVEKVKNGHRPAADQLIRRYQDRAFAISLRMMSGDREKAMELTQEAFLTALRKIKSFEGKSSFYTWFYRILVNTCLDALRRRNRWRRLFLFRRPTADDTRAMSDVLEEVPSPDSESNPASAHDARELKNEINRALTQLSDRQKMIFQLKVFEEMRISEIGQLMGLAEGTVKSHLFRATQTVRRALSDWTAS